MNGSTIILKTPEEISNYAKPTKKAIKNLTEHGMHRTRIGKSQVTFYIEPFNG